MGKKYELYYHLIWHTLNNKPQIAPKLEEPLRRYIFSKAGEIKAMIWELGMVPDHIHIIASFPPTMPISYFIKRIKGSSSRFVGKKFISNFYWQNSYGAFSVSKGNLPRVRNYIKKQKEHHGWTRKRYLEVFPQSQVE